MGLRNAGLFPFFETNLSLDENKGLAQWAQ